MVRILAVILMGSHLLMAQTAPSAQWRALSFLEGTWSAQTRQAASGADASGTYTFRKELGGHILARHSDAAGCKGPTDFNCDHGDLLYVYEEQPGQPLRAIYFDNEGHTIHYTVSTPTPTSVLLLSDATGGPRFRLVYELKNGVMEGKFQMNLPGKTEWTSYLEWSGSKK